MIIVSGPTASGKTKFAIDIAQQLKGEIINGDSVQFYKYFDIGSAKPSHEEMEKVPHHLFDICDNSLLINAADFCDLVTSKTKDIKAREKIPILVGSSGLYLSALLGGLTDIPKDDNKYYRQQLNSVATETLYAELESIDAVIAQRINQNDRMRVMRALEIFKLTGIKPSEYFNTADKKESISALVLIITWERDKLYSRIDQRTLSLINQGIIEETEKLSKFFSIDHPALKSLGYAQCLEFLDGRYSKEVLIDNIAQLTRQYAKRQMTYWRNEPIKRGWSTEPKSFFKQNKTYKEFTPLRLSTNELIEKIKSRMSRSFVQTEVWYLAGELLVGID